LSLLLTPVLMVRPADAQVAAAGLGVDQVRAMSSHTGPFGYW